MIIYKAPISIQDFFKYFCIQKSPKSPIPFKKSQFFKPAKKEKQSSSEDIYASKLLFIYFLSYRYINDNYKK